MDSCKKAVPAVSVAAVAAFRNCHSRDFSCEHYSALNVFRFRAGSGSGVDTQQELSVGFAVAVAIYVIALINVAAVAVTVAVFAAVVMLL